MIRPKGLNYIGFNENHSVVVIRKFSEDRNQILPVGLFSPQNFLVVVAVLCQSKPPHLFQLCKHICQRNCAQTTSSSFSLL